LEGDWRGRIRCVGKKKAEVTQGAQRHQSKYCLKERKEIKRAAFGGGARPLYGKPACTRDKEESKEGGVRRQQLVMFGRRGQEGK